MQTTSLELSKKLKAIGVPQKSEFYWVQNKYNEEVSDYNVRYWMYDTDLEAIYSQINHVSAFLSCEIGELLPDFTCQKYGDKFEATIVLPGKWVDMGDMIEYESHDETADTEAEARGLLLEYLIQQGIINFNL